MDKKELDAVVYEIKDMCPVAWAKIGQHLIDKSIPRGTESERLDITFVEKATIVGIIDDLGFKFKGG